MMEKLFFQSSLPRAGSTMLQNILAQNPDVYATPTSGVLELIYGARANYSSSPEFKAQDTELMKQGYLSFCKNGVECTLVYYFRFKTCPNEEVTQMCQYSSLGR